MLRLPPCPYSTWITIWSVQYLKSEGPTLGLGGAKIWGKNGIPCDFEKSPESTALRTTCRKLQFLYAFFSPRKGNVNYLLLNTTQLGLNL